jgi:hypothetical protein
MRTLVLIRYLRVAVATPVHGEKILAATFPTVAAEHPDIQALEKSELRNRDLIAEAVPQRDHIERQWLTWPHAERMERTAVPERAVLSRRLTSYREMPGNRATEFQPTPLRHPTCTGNSLGSRLICDIRVILA